MRLRVRLRANLLQARRRGTPLPRRRQRADLRRGLQPRHVVHEPELPRCPGVPMSTQATARLIAADTMIREADCCDGEASAHALMDRDRVVALVPVEDAEGELWSARIVRAVNQAPLLEQAREVLRATYNALRTFSPHVPQSEQGWTTSDSEALEAARTLLATLEEEPQPSATVCGHRGCRLRPGHIPGHTDR